VSALLADLLVLPPPHDMAAERAVLGGILVDPDALAVAMVEQLVEGDFHKDGHRLIFAAIAGVLAAGSLPDVLSVTGYLQDHGQFGAIGGGATLAGLLDEAATSPRASQYARRLRELRLKRQAGDLALRLYGEAMNEARVETIAELGALEALRQEAAGLRPEAPAPTLGTAIEALLPVLREPLPVGTGSPWPGLTRILGDGVRPGEMVLIGGRPGVGKSALAAQWAAWYAEHGVPVLFASLEMGVGAITTRILVQHSGVAASHIRRHALTDPEWAVLTASADRMRAWSLEIETGARTAEAIGRCLRASQHRQGTQVLFLDYLQLVEAAPRPRDRRIEVEHVSRALKLAAVECGVAVIALSSVVRPERSLGPRPPSLADLRESGALEHDCDFALFLWRPDPEIPQVVECVVRKARDAALGSLPLYFLGERLLFVEQSDREETR